MTTMPEYPDPIRTIVAELEHIEKLFRSLQRSIARRGLSPTETADYKRLLRRRRKLVSALAAAIPLSESGELAVPFANEIGPPEISQVPKRSWNDMSTSISEAKPLSSALQHMEEGQEFEPGAEPIVSKPVATHEGERDGFIRKETVVQNLDLPDIDLRSISNLSDGLANGLPDTFSQPSFTTAGRKPLDPQFFVDTFVAISGSEIEAEEIQLGIILGPPPRAGTTLLPVALVPSDLKALPETDTRSVIKYLREEVLPRSVGTKVLVMSSDRLQAHGVYQVAVGSFAGSTSPSSGNNLETALRSITQNPAYLALWIKPARAIRVYKGDSWIAQVISVRDGLGWSLRVSSSIEAAIDDLVASRMAASLPKGIAETLSYLLMELSEMRRGGSVFIVSDETCLETLAPVILNREAYQSAIRYHYSDMLELMQQDGALVISVDGIPLASGVYFNGEGGRKRIARQVCSGAEPVVALVVSQDGYILLNGSPKYASGASLEIDGERFRAG